VEDLASFILDRALRAGASYADVRILDRRQESVNVRCGRVEALQSTTEAGVGVRVIADGAWGFAASADLSRQALTQTAELAVRIAKASAQVNPQPVVLEPAPPVRDQWQSQFRTNPFDVPVEDKIDLLLDADRVLREREKITVSGGSVSCREEQKVFASTEGSLLQQHKLETGGQVFATAVEGPEAQERSYPSSMEGLHAAAGYELIEEMDLMGGAQTIGREAVELLSAPRCPQGEMPVIIDASHMALQIHESCGHPIELDRVFGSEASYAGTSFLTPDKLGSYRYGSDLVSIYADATVPGALGTFGYDDEGTPAQRSPIVVNGVFQGYLSSREMAARLGRRSSGAMRAEGWNRLPLIRMTNINLEPGDWSLEEMIKDTRHGLYLQTTRSWSIDDQRLNFQFGCQVGWMIENGAITHMVSNANYQGVTPQFWATCDAIGHRDEWRMWGVVNCAKGQPVQLMHVGHGVAPTRFSRVRVGM